VRRKPRDPRQRRRIWRRTRGLVILRAYAARNEWTYALAPWLPVQQDVIRERMRLRLHVPFQRATLQEGIAVVIEIADLAGKVLIEIFADHADRHEAIANSLR